MCRIYLIFMINVIILTKSVYSGQLNGLLQDLVNQDFNTVNISDNCKNDLITIRTGLDNREIWALKLLDASSHVTSDFVWGNNIFTGTPRSCRLVNEPKRIIIATNYEPVNYPNLTLVGSPMAVDYRVMHARHHSKMQISIHTVEKNVLDMGFCMPLACNDFDSERLFTALLKNESFVDRNLFGMDTKFLETKLLIVKSDFFQSPFVKAFLYILLITMCLVVFDIFYKIFIEKISNNLTDLDKGTEKTMLVKVISCFSVIENIKLVFSTKDLDKIIHCINGIRAVGMYFFIVAHIGIFGASGITNMQHLFIFSNEFWIQPLVTVHLTIDTYYVLSGTLLSYITFRMAKSNKIRNNFVFFLQMVLNRYLRLVPAYMIQMLLIITVNRLVKQISPYYLMDDNETKCEGSWWKNLIFINNYQPMKDTCMMWGYYVATDFQYFLICLVIILISRNYQKLAIILFVVILITCTVVSGYYGYELLTSLTLNIFYNTAEYLYSPFWARIGPYFAGFVTGWYLNHTDRKLQLHKGWITLGWLMCFAIITCCSFAQIHVEISPVTGAFYASFTRISWGIAISWVIIACATQNGGIINKFLSANFFLPFSRLTYCAYLVNPSWILITLMLNDRPLHVDFAMLPIMTIGFVISVYLIALIFALLFEIPYVRLSKLLRF